jgi:methylmalonyl-CoA mutase N-terminal domain/subunit
MGAGRSGGTILMYDRDKLVSLVRMMNEWERGPVAKTLARFPEQKKEYMTSSDIPVPRVATPADCPDLDYEADLGVPGEYPFTRGVQPTMYRGRHWTMRQYAGFGSAQESNRRYKYLLEQGQTGLSVAFDLPTQIGYDSDHPAAAGEVGKVGVSISSLEDMETLFDGIPLDKVSTSMTINAPAAVLLAMYVAVAAKQGVAARALQGTIQNDILKEYAARGTYIFPPRPSMRLITDIFAYCASELPEWNSISVSGYHMREAGCTAVQEVAFTLANGLAYVKAGIDAGLDVDAFSPRLAFFFGAHTDFFEEAAKFRAARRLWASLMRDKLGSRNPRSWMLRFHTQTAGSTLTAQQPENNVVRVALQALAAVLGGTQSLHTNSRDEALALPSEDSVRIALRTQQVIAYESGVADSVDPLAGSYLVEYLTDQIEARAREYLDRIEAMGGAVAAVERGFIQEEIHESAYRYQREIEAGQRVIVGVNRFQGGADVPFGLLEVDAAVEEAQRDRLADLRRRRDAAEVAGALGELREAAVGGNNVMPSILRAVRAYATIGEICDVLRGVFGEYRPATGV